MGHLRRFNEAPLRLVEWRVDGGDLIGSRLLQSWVTFLGLVTTRVTYPLPHERRYRAHVSQAERTLPLAQSHSRSTISMATRLPIDVIKFESARDAFRSVRVNLPIMLGRRVTFTPVVRHLAFIVSLRSLQSPSNLVPALYFIRRFAFNETPAKRESDLMHRVLKTYFFVDIYFDKNIKYSQMNLSYVYFYIYSWNILIIHRYLSSLSY